MVKMEFYGASNWPKLISRKIWESEKSWNFHIVYSQLGCLGLYSDTNIDRTLFLLQNDYNDKMKNIEKSLKSLQRKVDNHLKKYSNRIDEELDEDLSGSRSSNSNRNLVLELDEDDSGLSMTARMEQLEQKVETLQRDLDSHESSDSVEHSNVNLHQLTKETIGKKLHLE